LSAVPDSRLLILTVTDKRAADRILQGFAACGIGTERLELRPRVSHESFLAAHREVDIALDTFPYHGTTTSCFSLWMGVPVVALTGPTHVSRVGLSLLSNVGLGQLAVSRQDEYVATAAQVATDREALARIRSTLRERVTSSPLTDGAACARALEHAYGEMLQASRDRASRQSL
jgi:predicted O-linked N-acetylglucosamine transferase (SPINDLY family)